eukprot:TRINITY_DN910_c1_g2_i1.p1 TRINITY_DN910_c1_g2~~TRINITY_DN910_c1_g2_i1.p1  ORF type:complete len:239 (+),score=38.47 TRINITY_DN910_c1_g2_i1:255-971(+)
MVPRRETHITDKCMSCDMTVELSHGVFREETDPLTAGVANITFGDSKLVRCWFDAKARPMYIVTPVRHVEAMNQLSDDELGSLWKTGVELVINEGFQEKNIHNLIINHGIYRNHAHLHLKITIDDLTFITAKNNKWTPEKQKRFQRLVQFNKPRRSKLLKKYPGKSPGVFVKGLTPGTTVEELNNHFLNLGITLPTQVLLHRGQGKMLFKEIDDAISCMINAYAVPLGKCEPKFSWLK